MTSAMYNRLPHGAIRLLQVLSEATDEYLSFRFVEVQPDTTIMYTAVSYTWGIEEASETAIINGIKIKIRPNLWDCLRYLTKFGWRFIWADAICINQHDIVERNSQVRLMDQIYGNATIVSAWLGHIPLASLPTVHSSEPIRGIEVDYFDWADSMTDLATRPYWSRSWVIQEFLLAKDVHLYCSNQKVDVSHFQDMFSHSTDVDLLQMDTEDVWQQSHIMLKWPALGLLNLRHIDRYPGYRQPLYDLLVGHPLAQSSDPRDRVFALLGLVHHEERCFLERSFPDYGLTLEQVHIVTLGHLNWSARDRPAMTISKALGIEEVLLTRYMHVVDRFDYIGSANPAVDVKMILDDMDAGCHHLPPMTAEWPTAQVRLDATMTLNDVLEGKQQVSQRKRIRFRPLILFSILSITIWYFWPWIWKSLENIHMNAGVFTL